MAQRLIQTQAQKQQQVQRLSQQQMLQVRLLEMPLAELEQNVTAELDDNPALEVTPPDDQLDNETDTMTAADGDDHADSETTERQERDDEIDSALETMGMDDELPDYAAIRESNASADREEMVYGDPSSFYDKLQDQVAELELTTRQRQIIEYIIGSLDEDGLLRKPFDTIEDELAVYHAVDTTDEEVGEMLETLQEFDPAGIGARDLRECLLLQLGRRRGTEVNMTAYRVIDECYDLFIKKHWSKIQDRLGLTDKQTRDVQREILRLNPKPGAALGETQGSGTQQIIPDFIVDTADDGTVTFSLNKGNVPDLYVSPSFTDMVKEYKTNKANMSRQAKEALLYARQKVERAQGYIEAVKLRRQTLATTMRAIIATQRKFFQDGDEADLVPMVLKDVADKTGLDISTISRVSNIKYAQTKWGTFPLRFFFSDGYTTGTGEELSTRKMKATLRELVDAEDKSKPLSDDTIRAEMQRRGFPIARRTVAKYREQLGIPVARLRKQ